MATHAVRIRYDYEFGRVTAMPPSLDYVEAGDTVEFSGGTFTGFSGTFWTNTSNISSSGTKTAKSGVTSGSTTYVTGSTNGKTISIPITFRTKDKMPDPFGFSDVTDVDPKALIKVNSFKVTGINTSVSASISSSAGRIARLYKTSSATSVPKSTISVSNNDYLILEVEAEYDYMEELTITLTVGERTESFRVINRDYPLVDQVVDLGITSGNLRFKQDVVNFFGSKSSQPKLTDYLRGNDLVPSIAQNAHVPTSPPIQLRDLLGTSSALYFRFRPPSKGANADTTSSAQSRSLTWNMETDYNIGYGELAKELEYRYVVTREDNLSDDISITTPYGNHSSWSQNNHYITIGASSGQAYVEKFFRGKLTIYVRNAIDTSLVISQTVNWSIMFYGP